MSACVEYPNWGILEDIGLSDDVVRRIVLNNVVDDSVLINLPDQPSHGILIELYYSCLRFSSSLKLKMNVILKKCVDTLFPSCVVSRADRLERRLRGFCVTLSKQSKEEQAKFLKKNWRPQPTGIATMATSA